MKEELENGKIYEVCINGQIVDGVFIRKEKTIFGERYLFKVGNNERNEDGEIMYTNTHMYKVKYKDIL